MWVGCHHPLERHFPRHNAIGSCGPDTEGAVSDLGRPLRRNGRREQRAAVPEHRPTRRLGCGTDRGELSRGLRHVLPGSLPTLPIRLLQRDQQGLLVVSLVPAEAHALRGRGVSLKASSRRCHGGRTTATAAACMGCAVVGGAWVLRSDGTRPRRLQWLGPRLLAGRRLTICMPRALPKLRAMRGGKLHARCGHGGGCAA